MELPYAVVSFLDEGDFSDEDEDITSEVPTIWLTSNKNECWWPKTTDVKTYIAKQKPPVEGSRKWILYNVKVEGYYENLEKARSAAADKKSESESSSNQNLSNKPYLRKRKQQLSHIREVSAEREDSPDSDALPTAISDPPKLNRKKNMKPISSTCSSYADFEIPDTPKSPPRNQRKDSNQQLHSQTRTDVGSKSINSNVSRKIITNSELPIHNQKKDSNVLSHSQLRFDIQSLPIDFETNGMPSRVPASPIGIQRKDTNLPLYSRTVDDSLINLEINDFDFNLDTATADSKTTKLIEDQFSKLADILAQMLVTQKSVDQRLSEIENKINVHGTARHREDFKRITGDLPFQDTVDIQTFEVKLADADFHRIFVQYVGQIGGNSSKENTLRILRKVFTNSVARTASWCGLRTNFQLSNLKVIAAIKEGVRLSYTCMDKDFEDTVSGWFRQGKQRFKRQNEPKNPQPYQAANNQNR